MSHELFELFGMLGIGVGLMGLVRRAAEPILLRLPGNTAAALQPLARLRQPGAAHGSNPASSRGADPRRFDSLS